MSSRHCAAAHSAPLGSPAAAAVRSAKSRLGYIMSLQSTFYLLRLPIPRQRGPRSLPSTPEAALRRSASHTRPPRARRSTARGVPRSDRRTGQGESTVSSTAALESGSPPGARGPGSASGRRLDRVLGLARQPPGGAGPRGDRPGPVESKPGGSTSTRPARGAVRPPHAGPPRSGPKAQAAREMFHVEHPQGADRAVPPRRQSMAIHSRAFHADRLRCSTWNIPPLRRAAGAPSPAPTPVRGAVRARRHPIPEDRWVPPAA